MSCKVLLTGISGWIGKHIAIQLLKEGHHVVGTVRNENLIKPTKETLKSKNTPLDNLSFVETHDCFTIAELIEYEAMGLTKIGEGYKAIEEGWVQKSGKLPINPSGGLKSKGHPVGATGVSQHVMSAMQLTGEAGDMQINKPNLAGIFNMGGASVANYVSILERLR